MRKETNDEVLRISRNTIGLWGVTACLLISFFFLMFQGGKLSSMIFITVAILCVYLFLGRWSGIKRATGSRILMHGGISELHAGTALSVKLNVLIPGIWPIPVVFIKDRLCRKNGEEHLFEMSFVPDLSRRGEVSYRTPPLRRGFYQFAQTDCSTEDIFGIFEHRGTLDLPSLVRVLPQTVPIRDWNLFHEVNRGMHPFTAQRRDHRETTQINGIRDYIYGDRLSRIHWNATARTGTLKSKEFEPESQANTVLVLDCDAASYPSQERFELAVSVTASILEYCQGKGLPVSLLSNGGPSVYSESNRHSRHEKIMNELIEAEPNGDCSLLDALKRHARFETQGSFFVWITPRHDADTVEVMHWMRHRGMNPCHIWLKGDAAEREQLIWRKQLQTHGYAGYAVSSLADLPIVLGGKAYAG